MCLTYFGLGDHEAESNRQLLAYYAFIAERAEWVAKSAARSDDEVRARIDAFREIGADELIFTPSVPDVDQVDLLADAAGLDGVEPRTSTATPRHGGSPARRRSCA